MTKQKKKHRHRYNRCGDYKNCNPEKCFGGVYIYCRCGKRKP